MMFIPELSVKDSCATRLTCSFYYFMNSSECHFDLKNISQSLHGSLLSALFVDVKHFSTVPIAMEHLLESRLIALLFKNVKNYLPLPETEFTLYLNSD